MRRQPLVVPFALTWQQSNSDRIYCLNERAEREGIQRGMGLADARALCPDLQTMPANREADELFLRLLARWAGRYCPWVGLDGDDGLVLDVTGSTHLFGGELALLETMHERLTRAGLTVRLGMAESRGGAWALAHYGEGEDLSRRMARPGKCLEVIGGMPVAALRLDESIVTGLLRLGVRTIEDLYALPRSTVTRRFGLEPLMRLDQALAHREEAISPLSEPQHYGVRMSLPEPIGLASDVMAVAEKLLERLCDKLVEQGAGVRVLQLTMRRLDMASSQVELRLARPMRDASRILPLFERGVDEVDSGFGIDIVRLEAVVVETVADEQLAAPALGREQAGGVPGAAGSTRPLDDLITRLGSRIGLENVLRFVPADSHIPEHSFSLQPAAFCEAVADWPRGGVLSGLARPLRLFPPEPIVLPHACGGDAVRREPPVQFRWRRMHLTVERARGPERIAPEWWWEDPAWRSGLRDYWWVETRQGWRLWLFHTPQNALSHLSSWFVQGEFA
ncbi:protein ImuB [Cohaesibacter sp. ES.047]|uniref:Y-family DNA polymerase n=1 Tax=Cohaesibacter sp. ES.047 TaxID=1798205 RepID=UPI000BBFE9DE|nr:DNA polymerase Y family protein [Cohaesibacter sp. ES.047]SNY91230.1 protein ImuB [Cohaesibacter sp. ES.047]